MTPAAYVPVQLDQPTHVAMEDAMSQVHQPSA
jgi:hypothetical protein